MAEDLWVAGAGVAREHLRDTSVFPKLVEKLNPMIQARPKVETYEVATTTLAVAV